MKNCRRGEFVKVFKCNQMLLGHPVMSDSGNYITVAFDFYPRASDYERFEKAGWAVHGHLGQNDLCLNTHDRKFFEVTFRICLPVPQVVNPEPIKF